MINQDSDVVTENNNDFYYFYQSSTGENLFLHNVSYKMLHQQFSQDYTLYPLHIEAKIEEIEYDILDIHGAHKKIKYLDYLADNTPFGMVEVDMAKIVTKEVYEDNLKQIQSR